MTFIGVMAGEWLKLRKQRSFVWATLSALVVSMALSALGGSLLKDEWSKDPVGALGLTVSMPSTAVYPAALLFGLGLCVWLAGEFLSGSNYLMLLVVPRRVVLFCARLALAGILSLLLGAVVAFVGAGSAFLFVGPDRMSAAVSETAFWGSTAVTLLISVSTALLYFAAATLTRRSLPAVGIIAVLFFVLPSVEAYASFMGGPAVVSQALHCLPGSLASNALAGSSGGATVGFSSFVASVLLMSWSLLLVAGAAWRFSRYE